MLANLQLSTNEEKYSSKENLSTQTITSLTAERDSLKTANSALSQQIDDLKQHLGNHSNLNFEIGSLQTELNRYKKLFEDNSAVVDKLRQNESNLQVQLATKSTELNNMLTRKGFGKYEKTYFWNYAKYKYFEMCLIRSLLSKKVSTQKETLTIESPSIPLHLYIMAMNL